MLRLEHLHTTEHGVHTTEESPHRNKDGKQQRDNQSRNEKEHKKHWETDRLKRKIFDFAYEPCWSGWYS